MKDMPPYYNHETIGEAYRNLIKIYGRYLDMKEEYMKIASLWVLACKYHSVFISFPYLYLNAMKGSGKTRFMNLTSFLVGGDVVTSITESVIFREGTPLFIDEAETISNKEKTEKRELLNTAYKKGGTVKRSVRSEDNKDFEVKNFSSFRPIGIANIEGLDDVLLDRCIPIVMERSYNKDIVRKMEMWNLDPDIQKVMNFLSIEENGVVSVVLDGDVDQKQDIETTYHSICLYFMGNDTNNTLHTTHTHDTNDTPLLTEQGDLIVRKIEDSDLMGRDMELWLPLLVTAAHISEEALNDAMKIAVQVSIDRRESNMMENPDVVLVGFLYDYMKDRDEKSWLSVSDMGQDFLNMNPSDEEWFNTKWLGRALVRNALILRKRRLGKGREVMLDKQKIFEKAKKYGLVEDLSAFTSNLKGQCDMCEAGNRNLIVVPDKYNPLKRIKMCSECVDKYGEDSK